MSCISDKSSDSNISVLKKKPGSRTNNVRSEISSRNSSRLEEPELPWPKPSYKMPRTPVPKMPESKPKLEMPGPKSNYELPVIKPKSKDEKPEAIYSHRLVIVNRDSVLNTDQRGSYIESLPGSKYNHKLEISNWDSMPNTDQGGSCTESMPGTEHNHKYQMAKRAPVPNEKQSSAEADSLLEKKQSNELLKAKRAPIEKTSMVKNGSESDMSIEEISGIEELEPEPQHDLTRIEHIDIKMIQPITDPSMPINRLYTIQPMEHSQVLEYDMADNGSMKVNGSMVVNEYNKEQIDMAINEFCFDNEVGCQVEKMNTRSGKVVGVKYVIKNKPVKSTMASKAIQGKINKRLNRLGSKNIKLI